MFIEAADRTMAAVAAALNDDTKKARTFHFYLHYKVKVKLFHFSFIERPFITGYRSTSLK